MKTELGKYFLALMSAFCMTLGLAGCNQEAEVPTAGDGAKQSSGEKPAEDKSSESEKSDTTNESEELQDDPTEGESGSILE
ncbi:MAG TPA: hypothetical protein VLA12_10965 [Planctomycetaceae bacterium]|nr:hypothetical protein [Planctomycetaceae bacterium]